MSKKLNIEKVATDRYVATAEKYCTNLQEIYKETGLSLTKKVDALIFVKNYTTADCPPINESEYRLCKLNERYIPIDEPMADLILKLNKKGYKTQYCCCGHQPNPNIPSSVEQYYISFEFGKTTFNLLSNIFEEFTGINVPFTEQALSVIAEPKAEYTKLFKNIVIEKRNDKIIFDGFWQQNLEFYYFIDNRIEAIKCINDVYSKYLDGI